MEVQQDLEIGFLNIFFFFIDFWIPLIAQIRKTNLILVMGDLNKFYFCILFHFHRQYAWTNYFNQNVYTHINNCD